MGRIGHLLLIAVSIIVSIIALGIPAFAQQITTQPPIHSRPFFDPTQPMMTIQGSTNQTGDLFDWFDQTGTLGCAISASAALNCKNISANSFNPSSISTNSLSVTGNAALNTLSASGAAALSSLSLAGPVTSFQDKGGQVFNVLAYGATGNGVANDTTAIQAAINAGCNGTAPGTIFFPGAKTFLISGLTMPANCIFTGGGTFVCPASANASIFMGSNTRITNLNFNGFGNIGTAALAQSGATNLRVDHSIFYNFQNGSLCFATSCGGLATPPSSISVDHNYFYNNQDGTPPGPIFNVQCGDGVTNFAANFNTFVGDGDFDIGIDGCQNSQIIGNYIAQGTNGFGGAIQPEATSESMARLLIENNTIISPKFANGYAACGIELHTNGNSGSGSGAHVLSNFIVRGNYVTGAPGGGICLFYSVNDTNTPGIVSGNITYKNTGAGISLSGGNLTVTGNVSMDNSGAGIGIACFQQPCDVAGNTATDDQATKTQTYGLVINAAPWFAVGGNGTNIFDGNLTGPVNKGSAFNSNTAY